MLHHLKTDPEIFQKVFENKKLFELRKNDRDFKVGHWLVLKEFDRNTQTYSGREICKEIEYLLKGGQYGLEKGYVAIQLSTSSQWIK